MPRKQRTQSLADIEKLMSTQQPADRWARAPAPRETSWREIADALYEELVKRLDEGEPEINVPAIVKYRGMK